MPVSIFPSGTNPFSSMLKTLANLALSLLEPSRSTAAFDIVIKPVRKNPYIASSRKVGSPRGNEGKTA
ncbi:hypothetical protein D3C80_1857360 [compost metagenome]